MRLLRRTAAILVNTDFEATFFSSAYRVNARWVADVREHVENRTLSRLEDCLARALVRGDCCPLLLLECAAFALVIARAPIHTILRVRFYNLWSYYVPAFGPGILKHTLKTNV